MYITHFNMENMNKEDLSCTPFQFVLVKWGDGLNWIDALAQEEKKYHLGGCRLENNDIVIKPTLPY